MKTNRDVITSVTMIHSVLRQLQIRTLLSVVAVAMGILIGVEVRAESPGETWVQRYNGPANQSDQPVAVAVDSSGNVIVTGWSVGNGNDFATIKYSGTGIPLWTNRFTGAGAYNDKAKAMAVDGKGDIVVAGWVGHQGASSYATVKYSGAGAPLWTNYYNSPYGWSDWASALAVDSGGNVLVTGNAGGKDFYLLFRYDFATIKYSNAGTPLWTNVYGGITDGDDTAIAIGVDANGAAYVTGASAILPKADSLHDYLTIKYSESGAPEWTNRFAAGETPRALGTHGKGGVFVTGYSAANEGDFATVGYSSTGEGLWTNHYNGSANRSDQAVALVSDSDGDVIVTGYSFAANNIEDFVTIKYSDAGIPLWTNYYKGPSDGPDVPTALTVDPGGNIFVTGYSQGNGTSNDIVTLMYSRAGVAIWTNRYDGPASGDDQATGVAADGFGNVFVTGYSTGNGSRYDYVTIKYSAVAEPLLTMTHAATNMIAISWPSPGADFRLQQATNLASAGWTMVEIQPIDDGTNLTVFVHAVDESRFFRLIK